MAKFNFDDFVQGVVLNNEVVGTIQAVIQTKSGTRYQILCSNSNKTETINEDQIVYRLARRPVNLDRGIKHENR